MKASGDIERLRSAEQEAQEIVARAREEAQRIRRDAEARVKELHAETDNAIASLRDRIRGESQREVEVIAEKSRESIVSARTEVSDKLNAYKKCAVKRVIEELTRVS